ncbi:hypothetical protein OsJ_03568 [Oryza sativa Japonica Group]|uniref:dCMP deaminase n=3 Tax=Oryza TaxID=4527 RepID=A2ZY54_ORYSJ|nr:hypothetical protein OsJ_03568 [Oryza sativa Japonica Group]
MWQSFGEYERFIHSWHVADEYLVALVVTSVYSPDAAAAVEEPGNRLLASSRAALAAGGGGHGWVPLSHHEQASKTPSRGYVVHAEVNAILNTNHASAAGQKLYVTMFPCNECAKIIIQSGVSEVIYFVEKRIDNSDYVYVASHKLLSMAGVKVRKHQPQMSQIPIKFQEPRNGEPSMNAASIFS